MALQNNNIILTARPDGLPSEDCWGLVTTDVPPTGKRELLVEVKHISLDPAMRAWMNEFCYIGGVDMGETMPRPRLEASLPAWRRGFRRERTFLDRADQGKATCRCRQIGPDVSCPGPGET